MDATRRLPDELVEHARSFLSGEREPAVPKHAATVMILRTTTHGPQVYLLRRHRGMAFAGGMYAFPGGGVDPRDSDHAIAWSGPTAAEWGDRLRADESLARALVCAAVRETFEESGVLLAGKSDDTVVADTTGDDWEQDRLALIERTLSFTDFLDRRGLVLRSDLLGAWAHWITPEFEPRRYDTRFFVAALPEGQRTRDVSGEADRVAWLHPPAACDGVDSGDMDMLPPTYIACAELSAYPTVEEVMAASSHRPLPTVLPGVEIVDGVGYLTVPDGVLP